MRRRRLGRKNQASDVTTSTLQLSDRKSRQPRFWRVAQSIGILGATVGTTSVAGYLLLLIASSYLSAAENTIFLGFWGFIMGLGSALSPIEQEISRHTADAAAAGRRPDATVVRAFAVTQTIAIIFGLVALVPEVSNKLFGPNYSLGVVAMCGVVAFPALYATRGLLIGAGKVGEYSAILLAEALPRVVFCGILVAMGVAGVPWFAAAVATGSFGWIFFATKARGAVDFDFHAESWRAVIPRMLGLILSAALTASVLTGYPAVVKLVAPLDSEERLAGILLAISLLRSPLLLILAPAQTLAIPTVVRISKQPGGARKLRRFVILGAGVAAFLGLAVSAIAYAAGPWLFNILYKGKYDVSSWVMACLGWSGIMLAAIMLAAAAMVARKKTSQVVAVWAAVAAASFALLVGIPGDIILRTVIGATVAPTCGLIIAILLLVSRSKNKISEL